MCLLLCIGACASQPDFVEIVMWLSICSCFLLAFALCRWGLHTSSRCARMRFTMPSQVWQRVMVFGVLLSHCRIGEAKNPGPSCDEDTLITMGAFNPSGLASKAPLVCNQMSHGAVWAISETHLCQQSFRQFQQGLKFERSKFTCIPGHHAPPRATACSAGTWKGVAVMSQYPVRRMMAGWPANVEKSSRVTLAATCVRDLWFHIGVIYGETEGKLHPRYLQNNEYLLQAMVAQVVTMTKGMRIIAGDWNVCPGAIPSFQILEQAGFRDLQQLAFERWGIAPQNTCKGRTRKDFFYVSPEMQPLLMGVQVLPDIFADHAVLQGQFWTPGHFVPHTIWNPPQKFQWPESFSVDETFWCHSSGTIDQRYEKLWNHVETEVARCSTVPIPKAAKGRARECYTRVVKGSTVAPLKASRQGDVLPHFHGQSVRHVQWFKQIRRLQSYVRHVRNKPHSGVCDHGHQLWAAVLNAKGFLPSFPQWWRQSKFRVPQAPTDCPCWPPSHTVASAIFDSVVLALRSFETSLKQQCSQYAKARRLKDPMLIFRDLKDGGTLGAEVFVAPESAKVVDFWPDEGRVVLDRPVDWNLTQPLMCQGHPLSVIHADHDCLWIDGSVEVRPDTCVTQQVLTGEVSQLFKAFADSWSQRWDRHRHVLQSQWSQILAFAHAHLPRQQLTWDPLTPVSMKEVIKRKKRSTAKGLDGVSLADLAAMPSSALQNFCDLCSEAESSGAWPECLVSGRVTCLPKIDNPRGPQDFRPITILGLLYRVWGSYNAQCALTALDPCLPDGLFGSRPKCFSAQIWLKVILAIEESHLHQTELCGLVCDLQKAFNTLPRPVVAESLAIMGIPFRVLTAWSGAVSTMQRRFQLQGSMGPRIPSSAGYPEGDAMSCVAMVGIDALFHFWATAQFPLCAPLTYVDDWQLLLPHAGEVPQLLSHVERFTQLIDVKLDGAKTYTWSTSGCARRFLRQQDLGVQLHGRNLGAHVQMCRKHTNFTQMARIAQLKLLWQRLRLSAAPYAFKIRAIRCAAWPRALHAIAATSLSAQTFKAMRAGAMKGLRQEGAGTNAVVHLGLVEQPETDPLFWSIVQTFRTIRGGAPADRIQQHLALWAKNEFDGPRNSVTATLVARISKLGWKVRPDGLVCDHIGPFSLHKIGYAELHFRASWQWPAVVATYVHHRRGFQGLQFTDPGATRRWLRILQPSDAGAFRKLLNGTHVTQDGKAHCQQDASNLCPWCASVDSRYHRFWICEYFQQERSSMPHDIFKILPSLPEAVTCYGWALRAWTQNAWLRLLAAIPEPSMNAFSPLPANEGSVLHLFTDGSCYDQQHASVRFASWGVVVAGLSDDGLDEWKLAGFVPGILQSAYRAEVWALRMAVRVGCHFRRAVHVWSDCAAVVASFRRILRGEPVPPNHPHRDLWEPIAADVRRLGASTLQITKVASHVQIADDKVSPLQSWCAFHNSRVDAVAGDFNLARGQDFWDFYTKHTAAVGLATRISREVQHVQLAISRVVLRENDGSKQVEATEALSTPVVNPLPEWSPLPTLQRLPAQAVRWYGKPMVNLLMAWFWQVLTQPRLGHHAMDLTHSVVH